MDSDRRVNYIELLDLSPELYISFIERITSQILVREGVGASNDFNSGNLPVVDIMRNDA